MGPVSPSAPLEGRKPFIPRIRVTIGSFVTHFEFDRECRILFLSFYFSGSWGMWYASAWGGRLRCLRCLRERVCDECFVLRFASDRIRFCFGPQLNTLTSLSVPRVQCREAQFRNSEIVAQFRNRRSILISELLHYVR